MGLAVTEGVVDGKPARFILTEDALEIRSNEVKDLEIALKSVVAVCTPNLPQALNLHRGRTPSMLGDEDLDLFFLQAANQEAVGGIPLSLRCVRTRNLPGSLIAEFFLSQIPDHLLVRSYEAQSNIHVIISTLSGIGQARSVYDNVVSPLLTALMIRNYEVHDTTTENTISELTTQTLLPRAIKGIQQTVILLSGDGGPSDMINALLGGELSGSASPPFLGLMALGTGNALANSSGLNNDNTLGLSAFLRGKPRPIPTFKATFSPSSARIVDEGRAHKPIKATKVPSQQDLYGTVVCSWGLHASLVAESDTAAYRKFGAERFKMVASELLQPSDGSKSHAYKGKVTIVKHKGNDRIQEIVERTEHMYVLATMVSNLERSFTISPASKPLDGQLRLLHFGPIAGDEVVRVLGLAYQGGRHVEDELVRYEAVDSVSIEFEEEDDRWRRVCVDGKIVLVEKGGWLEVRKEEREVLKLIVPDIA